MTSRSVRQGSEDRAALIEFRLMADALLAEKDETKQAIGREMVDIFRRHQLQPQKPGVVTEPYYELAHGKNLATEAQRECAESSTEQLQEAHF